MECETESYQEEFIKGNINVRVGSYKYKLRKNEGGQRRSTGSKQNDRNFTTNEKETKENLNNTRTNPWEAITSRYLLRSHNSSNELLRCSPTVKEDFTDSYPTGDINDVPNVTKVNISRAVELQNELKITVSNGRTRRRIPLKELINVELMEPYTKRSEKIRNLQTILASLKSDDVTNGPTRNSGTANASNNNNNTNVTKKFNDFMFTIFNSSEISKRKLSDVSTEQKYKPEAVDVRRSGRLRTPKACRSPITNYWMIPQKYRRTSYTLIKPEIKDENTKSTVINEANPNKRRTLVTKGDRSEDARTIQELYKKKDYVKLLDAIFDYSFADFHSLAKNNCTKMIDGILVAFLNVGPGYETPLVKNNTDNLIFSVCEGRGVVNGIEIENGTKFMVPTGTVYNIVNNTFAPLNLLAVKSPDVY